MRYPLWLINSGLLFLLIGTLILVLLQQEKTPSWVTIEPTPYTKLVKQALPETALSKIYENDLFDTDIQQAIQEKKKAALELPPPPEPIPVQLPAPPAPKFIDPLPITLKGIIIAGDGVQNRIIVADNKTKVEKTYRHGAIIEDARLIHIFKNRAIFLRSNGQEEILYLRERDAKLAPWGLADKEWQGIIQREEEGHSFVDPDAFAQVIPSLADFLSALDLITVYTKGKPRGLRVGHLPPDSFGHVLGLKVGDIITHVANIDITKAQQRLDAYRAVTELPPGSSFTVSLMRNNQKETLLITLKDLETGPIHLGAPTKPIEIPAKTPQEIEQEKRNLLEQKYSFAPTLEEIRKREKRTLLKVMKEEEAEEKLKTRAIKHEL